MPFWLHQSITPVPDKVILGENGLCARADELAAETVAGVTVPVTCADKGRVIGYAVVVQGLQEAVARRRVCTEWMGPVIMPMCSDVCSSRVPVAS